ncbi:MAG: YcaO-like family protein, partial [Pseudomonadota bacterium]
AALLETIERDAAAMWWRGGRPARALDLTDPALAEAAARIAAWREGAEAPRVAWALRLQAVADVPVIAVLTTDPQGRDLSVGVAARTSPAEALRAAAREAVQGELALDLIAERRAVHGDGVLGPADRDRLALAALDPARTPALMPSAPPGGPDWRPVHGQVENLSSAPQPQGETGRAEGETGRSAGLVGADSATMLKALVETPAIAQHSPASVNLTRPRFGLPVAFVAAACLQPFPAAHVAPRLAKAMEAAGGRGPEAPLF